MQKLGLADDDACFVCGKSNPIGLKLEFAQEGDEYVTYYTPLKVHQGYFGITHGGIVSTVLDEVMARYCRELGHKAVTGELVIRLRKPARTGARLRFAGRSSAKWAGSYRAAPGQPMKTENLSPRRQGRL